MGRRLACRDRPFPSRGVDLGECDFALDSVVQPDRLDLDPGAYLQLLVALEPADLERPAHRALDLTLGGPPTASFLACSSSNCFCATRCSAVSFASMLSLKRNGSFTSRRGTSTTRIPLGAR